MAEEYKTKSITVRITDSQWQEIQTEGNAKKQSASEIVRNRITKK